MCYYPNWGTRITRKKKLLLTGFKLLDIAGVAGVPRGASNKLGVVSPLGLVAGCGAG